MGSHCAKLSTGHSTGHGQGHESSMKKLMGCVSRDDFSLSSEEEEEEEEEGQEEEELPVQGKLLLMEPEWKEESTVDNPMTQQGPKPTQTCSGQPGEWCPLTCQQELLEKSQ
ncbi:protamine-3 [Carlito syrichta]|uniref:Protamine-3 n=1 Tax=Carlito syrichta TaxID=1868482 RepID=A0A1U7TQE8_CARSF|nr:protamine-3 [Carlito syrichta]